MPLLYTEHARRRMAKRQLQQEWIERVAANPARIEPDEVDLSLEHRLGIVPELANLCCGLLYPETNQNVSSPRISTAN
jgi:hypothetical protein